MKSRKVEYHTPIVFSTVIPKPISDAFKRYHSFIGREGYEKQKNIAYLNFVDECIRENRDHKLISEILRKEIF